MHRRRLNRLLKMVDTISVANSGKLADFGCSNGFILSLMLKRFRQKENWRFYGFDVSQELLNQARDRALLNTTFHEYDLNKIQKEWHNSFDIITSFETIEHVGNYENAAVNLYNACKTGGTIFISVPNENHIPGLVKYLGRRIFRRNAYDGFFDSQSEVKYLWHLLTDRPIAGFRTPGVDCWTQHLGFDWRQFDDFLCSHFFQPGRLELIRKEFSTLNFGLFYLLEKTG